jgi:aryl sulfotransferase
MANVQSGIAWPKKTRELYKFVVDSRRWNDFVFRDDDIVISTWAKSGTTLTQQICAQLVFNGTDLYGPNLSPWIDLMMSDDEIPRAIAQTHRRFLKTHLPIDTIVYSPKAKYIFIGRDGRDTFWSWYNHWSNNTPEDLAGISARHPGEPPVRYPHSDIRTAFLEWLDEDGYPNWPYFSHKQGWFDARHLPNLLLLHFNDLRADLPGQIRRIAQFLEIEIDPARFEDIVAHCSLDYMRRKADTEDEILKAIFKNGANTFFFKGTNGRWKDILTAEDNARYQREVEQRLSPECAHWLETARLLN